MFFYDFPYIGNVIIPTDELIFFRGLKPPTRHRWMDGWIDRHIYTQVRISISYDGDITQRKRAKYLIGLKRLDGYFSYN